MNKIQEIVVKLSYFGFTRACGEVVVSECHVIPSPVNLIGCPVKCVGTANLVVKLSVTQFVWSSWICGLLLLLSLRRSTVLIRSIYFPVPVAYLLLS